MSLRVLPLLTAAVVAAGLAAPAASSAALPPGCNAQGGEEVCFNDARAGLDGVPGTIQQRGAIFTRIRQLVREARPGDEVRMAMFSWDATGLGVARALRDAAADGADVAVVVGSSTSKEVVDTLRSGPRGRRVAVTRCARGCISRTPGSIQHAKFLTLRLANETHTVVTSSNLSQDDRDKRYNNLVHTVGDDHLYLLLHRYWEGLRRGTLAGMPGGASTPGAFTSSGDLLVVSPRAADSDPILAALDAVKGCTPEHGRVWVAMNIFTTVGRSQALRAKLTDLATRLGCDVRLVVGKDVSVAGLPAGRVRRSPASPLHPPHHKFLVVDALGADGAPTGFALTGSQNVSQSALVDNDELTVAYSSAFVRLAFLLRFDELYSSDRTVAAN